MNSGRGGEMLLIGVTIPSFNYAENDVDYVKETLINEAFFRPENVRTLKGSEATTEAIKEQLKIIMDKISYYKGDLGREAVFLFYFSEHGTRVYSQSSLKLIKGLML